MGDALRLRGPILVGPNDVRDELWVLDGRITFTAPAGESSTLDGWVVPGLTDAHCHVGLDAHGAVDAETAEAQITRDRDHGTLLIRDAGSPSDTRWIDDRPDLPKLIRESKEGLERVRRIILDLKDFSRSGENDWQWADLHACLDSTINIAWNELKYKADVERQYGELPKVRCLPSQLNQVFMNLLVNAAQAIEQRGRIVVRTASIDGQSVWVEIEDSGQGLSPEVQKRLFEPFFTTKPVGQGTGLGLSISFNIIEKHQGRIDVRSTPGHGTTFRITLPVNGSQHKETKA